MDIIDSLKQRYAVKKFNPEKKVSDEQLERLLEAANLSASSIGLQPYRFVLVKNPEIRKELVKFSFRQTKVAEASHLLILAACTNLDERYGTDYVNLVAKTRSQSEESLSGLKKMVIDSLSAMSEDAKFHWASKQAYIALGTLLTACALERIDSCPMEGFKNDKYDEILKLNEKNLRSVAAIVIGYRAEDDEFQFLKKVRRPMSEMLVEI